MAKSRLNKEQTLVNTVSDYREKAEVINPYYPEIDGIHTDLHDYYVEKNGQHQAREP